MNWQPFILTLELASITTFFLILVSIPIGYWLSETKCKLKPVIETIISMPLVLPPTVLGFYFLMVFSPHGTLGSILNQFIGINLIFSFTGLVVASVIYSLPFMVHPIYSGFSSIPNSLKEASYLMGASKLVTLRKILIPNIKASLLTGIVLSFAHTIGEFGVVLMIGGNIPNETRVASIAVYDQVESLQYQEAHFYSFVLFIISFTILLLVFAFNNKSKPFILK